MIDIYVPIMFKAKESRHAQRAAAKMHDNDAASVDRMRAIILILTFLVNAQFHSRLEIKDSLFLQVESKFSASMYVKLFVKQFQFCKK